jgi:hypothetical protein
MLNALDEPGGEIAERRFADAVSDTTMMNSEPLLATKSSYTKNGDSCFICRFYATITP